MIDPARIGRLAIEATDRVGILHHCRIHHLEGALAPHLHVLDEIHLPHPTLAQLAKHVIPIGDDRPDEITGLVLQPQGRAVFGAKPLIELVLRSAVGADLQTAHALSTRRISFPMRIR